MSLFSSPQSYLGVDFDSNSVKVVELVNENGRPRLLTYCYIDAEIDKNPKDDLKDTVLETAKLIKAVCRKAKTTTTKAVSALPAFSVFSSILNLPEMILDFKILNEDTDEIQPSEEKKPETRFDLNGNGQEAEKKGFLKIKTGAPKKYTKVLLTAAPKDLVKRYLDIFKAAGSNLLSLDTESFAFIRSLVGNDKSALMVVDIGSVVTNISVIANNIPILNRSIDICGLTITKAIADSLNVSLDRAEQFK